MGSAFLALLQQLALPVFMKCIQVYFAAGGGAAGVAAIKQYLLSLLTGVSNKEIADHINEVVSKLDAAHAAP